MYFNVRYDKNTMRNFAKDILRAVECDDSNITPVSREKLKMFAQLLSEADSCEILKLERNDE